MNAPLHHFLDALIPGTPVSLGPITIVPLRGSVGSSDLQLALLDDESARISEVSERGEVGRVRVESLTQLPLLLLAGELIRGARQNRQVDATLIIPPGGELASVPVSCVERGRWAYRGGRRGFQPTQTTIPWNMRSRTAARSLRAKQRRGQHDAGQGQVWRAVDEHLRRKQSRSATSDLLAAMSADLQQQVAAWTPAKEDVGGAFFVGDKLVGLEAFGVPAAWRSAAPRVLAGLFEEASGVAPPEPDAVGRESVSALLQKLQGIDLSATPGEGIGEELQGQSENTHLAALVASLEPGAEPVTVHLRASQLTAERERERERERPNRSEEHLEVDSPRRFRRGHRRRQLFERAHRLRSALQRPSVAVGGPCLVVSMRAYERFQRHERLPGSLPLPHRTAARLVIWRNPSMYPLLELAELLAELGLTASAVWSWNGDHDRLNELPNWLEVVSVRRNRVELRGTDS